MKISTTAFPKTAGYNGTGVNFKDNAKLAPLVREIAWTNNVIIVERCKDMLEREFYIRMTRKFGWSKNRDFLPPKKAI